MANTNKQIEANNLKVIKDQLQAEVLMNKKFNEYSSASSDSAIKGMCSQASEIHKQNFNNLKSYLDSHQ